MLDFGGQSGTIGSMASTKNTKTKGSVRGLFFKGGNLWYGVALELNIIVSGKSKGKVFLELQMAIKGYIASLQKAGFSDKLLNQKPISKYERMWNAIIERKRRKPITSPFFFAGVFPLEQYTPRQTQLDIQKYRKSTHEKWLPTHSH